MFRTLAAGVAVAATALAVAAPAALADPVTNAGKAVTPQSYDIVSIGADTDQSLFDQLSVDYNSTHATHNSTHPYIYGWDAENPKTLAVGDDIVTKSGCAKLPRPNGSSAGITTLASNTKDPKATSHYCTDLARSSRGRSSTDPAEGKGGVLFVALAQDAVTYATQATSNAPTNLTTKDLTEIYTCSVTNWSALGGKSGKIGAFLPPSSSGIRTFFLAAIGVTTPGNCVNSTPEQNEGTNKLLETPNAIFPYSVADYIAQRYHSAACNKTPSATQNRFGCNQHGTLVLDNINKTSPTVTTTVSGKQVVSINPKFTPLFLHTIYNVVRYNTSTTNHIPSYLQPFLDAATAKVKGYFCSNATAKAAIANYGFLASPLCGLGS